MGDEFTVPFRRLHHRELNQRGDELTWWQHLNIDPLDTAQRLWRATHRGSEAQASVDWSEAQMRNNKPRAAKANVSKLVERVAAGETVRITRRGKPVAVITAMNARNQIDHFSLGAQR